MIVFVEESDLSECLKKYRKNSKYLAVSSELLDIAGMVDASWLIPTVSSIADYQQTGDDEKYREEYYRYLSSPRIAHFLNLEILAADGIGSGVTFFCYSKLEKELLYPKFLRHFIIENLEIPKKYVLKYKNYQGKNKTFDDYTRTVVETRVSKLAKKFDETVDILG